MTIYNYNLQTDFSNGFDQSCLHNTICGYGFSQTLLGVHVEYSTNDVNVEFESDITSNEESELDTLVANHDPDNCEEECEIGYVIGAAGDASSVNRSETTSKNPVRKLRMNVTELPSGRYRIGWYYEWTHSSTSRDFRARVRLNNSVDLMYQSQEVKDWGIDQSIPVCGFSYQDLDEGDHFIDIDFWAEGFTSYIQNAKLEIWRVS